MDLYNHDTELLGRRVVWRECVPEAPNSVVAINIHGFFAGGRMYMPESVALADALSWRVVNPTLPGFGHSGAGGKNFHVSDLADTITALLDHLCVENAVLLGHSMGGAVAVAVAAQDSRVKGLVYRDGVAMAQFSKRGGAWAKLSKKVPLAALAGMTVRSAGQDLYALLGTTKAVEHAKLVGPETWQNILHARDEINIANGLWDLDLEPAVERIAKKKLPSLVVWGTGDSLVGHNDAQAFAAKVHAGVVEVPGTHAWMLSRPDAQMHVLCDTREGKSFLRRVNRLLVTDEDLVTRRTGSRTS